MTTVVYFSGSLDAYLRELVRRYWQLPVGRRQPQYDQEFIETFLRLP